MMLGTLCAILASIIYPTIFYLYGKAAQTFIDYTKEKMGVKGKNTE